MTTTEMYPASQLWTMVTELLRELKLDDKYTILDVKAFGYNPPDDEFIPSVWVEVFTRGANGEKTGTEVITRWVHYDVKYADWGKPPTDYPVIA